MISSRLVFTLLSVVLALSFPAHLGAHEHGEGPAYSEIAQAYDILVQSMVEHVFEKEQKLDLGQRKLSDAPVIVLNNPLKHVGSPSNNRFVAIQDSSMHSILQLAMLSAKVLDHPAHHHHHHPFLKELTEKLKKIPVNTKIFAMNPTALTKEFVRQRLRSVYELLSLVRSRTIRMRHTYSPAIFLSLVVLQGSFEAVESILMPFGIHAFCNIGNGAILGLILPLDRYYNMIFNKSIPRGFFTKSYLAFRSLVWELEVKVGGSLHRYNEQHQLIVHHHKSRRFNSRNLVREILQASGFKSSTIHTAQKNQSFEFAEPTSVESEIIKILDPHTSKTLKFFLALQQTRGLNVYLKAFSKLADAVRKNVEGVDKKTMDSLDRMHGKLKAKTNRYKETLLGNSLIKLKNKHQTYVVYKDIMESFKDLMRIHVQASATLEASGFAMSDAMRMRRKNLEMFIDNPRHFNEIERRLEIHDQLHFFEDNQQVQMACKNSFSI